MTDEMNLEHRLRAVENGLAVLGGEVREARRDIQDMASESRMAPRRDTCPHNEDFVRILAALEAGGKRFGAVEAEAARQEDAVEALRKRVTILESYLVWARGAKWGVVAFAAALGWIAGQASPILSTFFD